MLLLDSHDHIFFLVLIILIVLITGVTGNVLPDQVKDFIDHGVNEVLGKPVKMNVLKEAITRHMNGKDAGKPV